MKTCKGRLTTDIDYINSSREPIESGEHFHAPNPSKISAAAAVSVAKEDAVSNPDVPPRRIISNTMLNLSNETLSLLLSRRNFRRTLQRKRTRDEAFPARPKLAISKFLSSFVIFILIVETKECFAKLDNRSSGTALK